MEEAHLPTECGDGISMVSVKIFPFLLDVNECETEDSNNCDQICTNTEGGYECSCGAGTRLSEDRITCNSESLETRGV